MEKFEIPPINEKSSEVAKMQYALTSIAGEIQSFMKSEKEIFVPSKTFTVNKIKTADVTKCHCKYKAKIKRQVIAKLKKDLQAACYVAKTLELVKKKETTSLTNQLAYVRDECVDLLEKYTNNIAIIDNLLKQNQSLNENLENLANFIHLGYEELKNIQSEVIEEPSMLAQLKKLIKSCGQFYADYCNELEISRKTKQRNRYLKNKIIILENNIEAIKEQVKALEYRNLRLKTENNHMRAKIGEAKRCDFKVAYSEINMKPCINEHENSTDEKRYQESGDSLQGKDCNLSTHLHIVNRLLSDQDTLLKDLTIISKEISIV